MSVTFTQSDDLAHNPAPGQQLLLTDTQIDGYRESGHWHGITLRTLLTNATRDEPDAVALVGYQLDATGSIGAPQRLTYAEFSDRVDTIAAQLATLGITEGDAVAVMLPNRIEFPILILAITSLGARYVGIPVASGEREMAAILATSQARAVVLVPSWRSAAPLAIARTLRPSLEHLDTIIVIDADNTTLTDGEARLEDIAATVTRDQNEPDAVKVCHLGFTSGTTGEPKGVMNSHDTLIAVLEHFLEHVGTDMFGDPIIQLVASPIGHHSGFLWGTLMTIRLGGTIVLMDRWDAHAAAQIIRRERVTTMVNAPTFLQDLLSTDLAATPTALCAQSCSPARRSRVTCPPPLQQHWAHTSAQPGE